jgi:methylmalonyl-CoA mutase cobalamin-binding domain/chain
MEALNEKAGIAIDQRRQELAEEIVSRQYQVESEIWERFGAKGREMSLSDQNFHLQYLSEAVRLTEPQLFAEYIAWVRDLFDSLGFPRSALATVLTLTKEVIEETYSEDITSPAKACIDAGKERLEASTAKIPSFISDESPLSDLARRYLDALLGAERHVASRLVLEAVEKGAGVKDIYTHVFQASQCEIGRLWQTRQITVAQEHYCTASTQLIMSQLYPYVFASEKVGRRLVATCVGGELHEIGARMVADFFEMDGWDTYYLGANTPTESVLKAVSDQRAHVLGVSVTMTFHAHILSELIREVRAAFGDQVKLLVGGYPFNIAHDLWRKVGADGYAPHAQGAITMANKLVLGESKNEPQ